MFLLILENDIFELNSHGLLLFLTNEGFTSSVIFSLFGGGYIPNFIKLKTVILITGEISYSGRSFLMVGRSFLLYLASGFRVFFDHVLYTGFLLLYLPDRSEPKP